MALAVCTRDVKFYEWPSIYFLGAYEVTAECMSAKSISWCCDGSIVLVVKNKGEPLLITAPTKSQTCISTHKCVSINNVYAGGFSKITPNLLALGMENGEVSLTNLETKEVIRYKKLPSGIQNLDISMDDQNILAGCFDGNIFLYDSKGRPAASFIVPNCYSLSTTLFSNYSNLLAGASKDGALAIWNSETTDLEFSCKEHTARITDIAFLENTVTSIGTDGFLCIFDLRTHDLISKNNLDGALSSLAYFPNSYDLAVGTYNQLRSYDMRNLKTPLRTLLINNGGHIKNIATCPISIQNKLSSEKLSASGDFSINSNEPSDSELKNFSTESETSKSPSVKPRRMYKTSEVKDLEKFINEYMKYSSIQFAEKMAQSFYALRINTSKQFICMGEKMNESWNNFISYLRTTGDSECDSTHCSRKVSKKDVGKLENL
ncbi:hypothetical protein ABEB36_007446 [Hypothenemus hampei]|uniref:Uncharacterized protein n=1 Tax=Hypothenemus hampei TaxID=57062 RepID=A0ABD1EUI6_HYPHA